MSRARLGTFLIHLNLSLSSNSIFICKYFIYMFIKNKNDMYICMGYRRATESVLLKFEVDLIA